MDIGLLSFSLLLCSYWDSVLWDNEVGCHFLPQIIHYKVEMQISCGSSK